MGFFLLKNERFYAEKTFDKKPCKSMLERASRKALAFRKDTDAVRPARVTYCQKEIGIKSDFFIVEYLD